MENTKINDKRPHSFRLSDRTIEMMDHVLEFTNHKNRTALIEEAVVNYCIFMTKRHVRK